MSSTSILRLGLLVADHLAESIRARYGDYPSLFEKWLAAAAPASTVVHWTVYDCVTGEVPDWTRLAHLDGCVITGSKQSVCEPAADQRPWIDALRDLVADLDRHASAVKLVGVCFGHQVLAAALGGSVQKNPAGWEVGWSRIALNATGQAVLGRSHVDLLQMHRDEVATLPKGRWLSMQAHPEFPVGLVRDLIQMRHQSVVFTDEQCGDWLARLVGEPVMDSQWMASRVLQFLMAPPSTPQ